MTITDKEIIDVVNSIGLMCAKVPTLEAENQKLKERLAELEDMAGDISYNEETLYYSSEKNNSRVSQEFCELNKGLERDKDGSHKFPFTLAAYSRVLLTANPNTNEVGHIGKSLRVLEVEINERDKRIIDLETKVSSLESDNDERLVKAIKYMAHVGFSEFTQRELAKRIGKDETWVSDVINGHKFPNV